MSASAEAVEYPGPVVVDCLGRELRAKGVADGSYTCPFCNGAVSAKWPEHAASKCANPACLARLSPPYPVELARETVARQDAAQRDRERWEREEKARAARQKAAAKWCREPGCGKPSTTTIGGMTYCDGCKRLDRCETKRCNNRGRNYLNGICQSCAIAQGREGQVFFLGRWRTPQEFALRITRAPEMKGVTWKADPERGAIVGTQGTFECVLYVKQWQKKG